MDYFGLFCFMFLFWVVVVLSCILIWTCDMCGHVLCYVSFMYEHVFLYGSYDSLFICGICDVIGCAYYVLYFYYLNHLF